MLTPKQILQILPVAFPSVKAGNTSENLLNQIKQIIYSSLKVKEVTGKVYNNIMNSIQLKNRVVTMFMNSKSSGTSDLHRLLLSLTDKINLKGSD